MPQAVRQTIVEAARHLVRAGLNQGSSGNISVRCDGGFLITPSGVDTAELTPDLVVMMTMEGTWSGRWRPSSEWRFHRDIFQHRPDVQAVVHCHSTAATALAVLGRPLPCFHYMVAIAGDSEVRCAPYATFGTQDLSDHILATLGNANACLLEHHGQIACGADLNRAMAVAVEVEHLSDIYLRLLPLGEPPRLSQEEMKKVLEKFKSYGANAQTGADDLLK